MRSSRPNRWLGRFQPRLACACRPGSRSTSAATSAPRRCRLVALPQTTAECRSTCLTAACPEIRMPSRHLRSHWRTRWDVGTQSGLPPKHPWHRLPRTSGCWTRCQLGGLLPGQGGITGLLVEKLRAKCLSARRRCGQSGALPLTRLIQRIWGRTMKWHSHRRLACKAVLARGTAELDGHRREWGSSGWTPDTLDRVQQCMHRRTDDSGPSVGTWQLWMRLLCCCAP